MPQRDPKKTQRTRILAYWVEKQPHCCKLRSSLCNRRYNEKKIEEAISDIGSDQYISDHFLTESSYFAKPGKKQPRPAQIAIAFFSLHLPLFSFSSVLHLFSKRTLMKNSRKSQSLMNDLKKA